MVGVYESAMQDFIHGKGKGVNVVYDVGDGEQERQWNFLRFLKPSVWYDLIEKQCVGKKIIDVGAGLGSYAIKLQEVCDVTAIDISPTCCSYMRDIGVKKVLCSNIYEHKGEYDLAICMMNNIGMTGNAIDLIDKLNQLTQEILYDRIETFTDQSVFMEYYLKYKGRRSKKMSWDYRRQGGKVLFHYEKNSLMLIS